MGIDLGIQDQEAKAPEVKDIPLKIESAEADSSGDVVDVPLEIPSPEELKAKEAVVKAAQPVAKPMYTTEEIETLLKQSDDGDAKVDFDRLSPEGKAIWKSVDRGLKPKLQERVELKRRLEALEERTLQQKAPESTDPKEQFYRRYRQDPLGFTKEVNAEIEKLADSDDPFDATKKIAVLNTVLNEFRERRHADEGMQSTVRNIQTEVITEIMQIAPNYAEVRDEVTKFAVDTMGYTEDEIGKLTNPAYVGKSVAVKNFKVVYNAYKSTKAQTAAEQDAVNKVVKLKPPQVEKAGTGIKDNEPKTWTTEDYMRSRFENQL